MNASAQNLDEVEDLDLRIILRSLWAGRWWLLACVVLFTAAFSGAALVMVPIYRAATVAVSASSDHSAMGSLSSAFGQLGGLASLAGVDLGPSGSQAQETLAVLRSREFTEAFIRDRGLMPELFHKRWDAQGRRWKGEAPTLAQAFNAFDRRVRSVSQDRRTGLITVAIEWHDPVRAAEWANLLVERLNEEMRSRAVASTKASVGYLEKELASTSAIDTRQAINRLMETQINQRMYANVTREYSLRVVDRALPPDPRDPVRPNKLLLFALGPALGLVFGAFLVLVKGALRR